MCPWPPSPKFLARFLSMERRIVHGVGPCSRSQCLSTSVSGIFPLERALAIDVTPGSLLPFSPAFPSAAPLPSLSFVFSFAIIEPVGRQRRQRFLLAGDPHRNVFDSRAHLCTHLSRFHLPLPFIFHPRSKVSTPSIRSPFLSHLPTSRGDDEVRQRGRCTRVSFISLRGCFVERGRSSAGFFMSLLARREILSVLYNYRTRTGPQLPTGEAVRSPGLEV